MSTREEHDFIEEYLTWMKGPGLDQDSLTVYNFGYERPLPFPSISLTPDTTMRFNLQTSGMQTQSRGSIVVIGEKYLDRFGEIMTEVERIHEESQALPLAIYVETEDDIKTSNISSHVTPSLVRILYRAVVLLSSELSFFPICSVNYHITVLDRPCQSSEQILIIPFRFIFLGRARAKAL